MDPPFTKCIYLGYGECLFHTAQRREKSWSFKVPEIVDCFMGNVIKIVNMSSTAYVRTKSLKLKLLPAGEEGTKDQVTEFSIP